MENKDIKNISYTTPVRYQIMDENVTYGDYYYSYEEALEELLKCNATMIVKITETQNIDGDELYTDYETVFVKE